MDRKALRPPGLAMSLARCVVRELYIFTKLGGFEVTAYLFRRKRIRSGVAAICVSLGTLRFASAAIDFSEVGGILVASPAVGAPGLVSSDMVVTGCSWCGRRVSRGIEMLIALRNNGRAVVDLGYPPAASPHTCQPPSCWVKGLDPKAGRGNTRGLRRQLSHLFRA